MAACDRRATNSSPRSTKLGDDDVIAIELDVTSAQQWEAAVDQHRRPIRVTDRTGQQRRRAASCPAGRRDGRGLRKRLAGQLSGRIPGHARRARADCARPSTRPSSTSAAPERSARSPQHCAYGSSKWALRGLTQTAAAELAPAGIRVNAVFPGPIATPMLDEATQERLAATSSFGRIGQPDRDRRRRRVPGLGGGVVHHRFGTGRRWWAMPADPMSDEACRSASSVPDRAALRWESCWRERGFATSPSSTGEDDVGGTWRINTYPGPGVRRQVAPLLLSRST